MDSYYGNQRNYTSQSSSTYSDTYSSSNHNEASTSQQFYHKEVPPPSIQQQDPNLISSLYRTQANSLNKEPIQFGVPDATAYAHQSGRHFTASPKYNSYEIGRSTVHNSYLPLSIPVTSDVSSSCRTDTSYIQPQSRLAEYDSRPMSSRSLEVTRVGPPHTFSSILPPDSSQIIISRPNTAHVALTSALDINYGMSDHVNKHYYSSGKSKTEPGTSLGRKISQHHIPTLIKAEEPTTLSTAHLQSRLYQNLSKENTFETASAPIPYAIAKNATDPDELEESYACIKKVENPYAINKALSNSLPEEKKIHEAGTRQPLPKNEYSNVNGGKENDCRFSGISTATEGKDKTIGLKSDLVLDLSVKSQPVSTTINNYERTHRHEKESSVHNLSMSRGEFDNSSKRDAKKSSDFVPNFSKMLAKDFVGGIPTGYTSNPPLKRSFEEQWNNPNKVPKLDPSFKNYQSPYSLIPEGMNNSSANYSKELNWYSSISNKDHLAFYKEKSFKPSIPSESLQWSATISKAYPVPKAHIKNEKYHKLTASEITTGNDLYQSDVKYVYQNSNNTIEKRDSYLNTSHPNQYNFTGMLEATHLSNNSSPMQYNYRPKIEAVDLNSQGKDLSLTITCKNETTIDSPKSNITVYSDTSNKYSVPTSTSQQDEYYHINKLSSNSNENCDRYSNRTSEVGITSNVSQICDDNTTKSSCKESTKNVDEISAISGDIKASVTNVKNKTTIEDDKESSKPILSEKKDNILLKLNNESKSEKTSNECLEQVPSDPHKNVSSENTIDSSVENKGLKEEEKSLVIPTKTNNDENILFKTEEISVEKADSGDLMKVTASDAKVDELTSNTLVKDEPIVEATNTESKVNINKNETEENAILSKSQILCKTDDVKDRNDIKPNLEHKTTEDNLLKDKADVPDVNEQAKIGSSKVVEACLQENSNNESKDNSKVNQLDNEESKTNSVIESGTKNADKIIFSDHSAKKEELAITSDTAENKINLEGSIRKQSPNIIKQRLLTGIKHTSQIESSTETNSSTKSLVNDDGSASKNLVVPSTTEDKTISVCNVIKPQDFSLPTSSKAELSQKETVLDFSKSNKDKPSNLKCSEKTNFYNTVQSPWHSVTPFSIPYSHDNSSQINKDQKIQKNIEANYPPQFNSPFSSRSHSVPLSVSDNNQHRPPSSSAPYTTNTRIASPLVQKPNLEPTVPVQYLRQNKTSNHSVDKQSISSTLPPSLVPLSRSEAPSSHNVDIPAAHMVKPPYNHSLSLKPKELCQDRPQQYNTPTQPKLNSPYSEKSIYKANFSKPSPSDSYQVLNKAHAEKISYPYSTNNLEQHNRASSEYKLPNVTKHYSQSLIQDRNNAHYLSQQNLYALPSSNQYNFPEKYTTLTPTTLISTYSSSSNTKQPLTAHSPKTHSSQYHQYTTGQQIPPHGYPNYFIEPSKTISSKSYPHEQTLHHNAYQYPRNESTQAHPYQNRPSSVASVHSTSDSYLQNPAISSAQSKARIAHSNNQSYNLNSSKYMSQIPSGFSLYDRPTSTEHPSLYHKPTSTEHPSLHHRPTSTEHPSLHHRPTSTEHPSLHHRPTSTEQPSLHHRPTSTEHPSLHHRPTSTEHPSLHHRPTSTEQPSLHHRPTSTEQPSLHHRPTSTEHPSLHHRPTSSEQPLPHYRPTSTEHPSSHLKPTGHPSLPQIPTSTEHQSLHHRSISTELPSPHHRPTSTEQPSPHYRLASTEHPSSHHRPTGHHLLPQRPTSTDHPSTHYRPTSTEHPSSHQRPTGYQSLPQRSTSTEHPSPHHRSTSTELPLPQNKPISTEHLSPHHRSISTEHSLPHHKLTPTEHPSPHHRALTTEHPLPHHRPTSAEYVSLYHQPTGHASLTAQRTIEQPSLYHRPTSTEHPSLHHKPKSGEYSSLQYKPTSTEHPSLHHRPSSTEQLSLQHKHTSSEYPSSHHRPTSTEHLSLYNKPTSNEHLSLHYKPNSTEHHLLQHRPTSTEHSSLHHKPTSSEHQSLHYRHTSEHLLQHNSQRINQPALNLTSHTADSNNPAYQGKQHLYHTSPYYYGSSLHNYPSNLNLENDSMSKYKAQNELQKSKVITTHDPKKNLPHQSIPPSQSPHSTLNSTHPKHPINTIHAHQISQHLNLPPSGSKTYPDHGINYKGDPKYGAYPEHYTNLAHNKSLVNQNYHHTLQSNQPVSSSSYELQMGVRKQIYPVSSASTNKDISQSNNLVNSSQYNSQLNQYSIVGSNTSPQKYKTSIPNQSYLRPAHSNSQQFISTSYPNHTAYAQSHNNYNQTHLPQYQDKQALHYKENIHSPRIISSYPNRFPSANLSLSQGNLHSQSKEQLYSVPRPAHSNILQGRYDAYKINSDKSLATINKYSSKLNEQNIPQNLSSNSNEGEKKDDKIMKNVEATTENKETEETQEDEMEKQFSKLLEDLASHKESVMSKKSRILSRRYNQKIQLQNLAPDELIPVSYIEEEESESEREEPIKKFRGKFKSIKDKAVERIILTYASHSDESATEMIPDDDASDFEEELIREIKAKYKKGKGKHKGGKLKEITRKLSSPTEMPKIKKMSSGKRKHSNLREGKEKRRDSSGSSSYSRENSSSDECSMDDSFSEYSLSSERERFSHKISSRTKRNQRISRRKSDSSNSDDEFIPERKTRLKITYSSEDSCVPSDNEFHSGRRTKRRKTDKSSKKEFQRKARQLRKKRYVQSESDEEESVTRRQKIKSSKRKKVLSSDSEDHKDYKNKFSKKSFKKIKENKDNNSDNNIVSFSDDSGIISHKIKDEKIYYTDMDNKSKINEEIIIAEEEKVKEAQIDFKMELPLTDSVISKLTDLRDKELNREDVVEIKLWQQQVSHEMENMLSKLPQPKVRHSFKRPQFGDEFRKGWQQELKKYKTEVARMPKKLISTPPLPIATQSSESQEKGGVSKKVNKKEVSKYVGKNNRTSTTSGIIKTNMDVAVRNEFKVAARPEISTVMQRFFEKVVGGPQILESKRFQSFLNYTPTRAPTGLTPTPSLALSLLASDDSNDSIDNLRADLPASDSVPVARRSSIANTLIKKLKQKYNSKRMDTKWLYKSRSIIETTNKPQLLPTPGISLSSLTSNSTSFKRATFFRKDSFHRYRENFDEVFDKTGINELTPVLVPSRTRTKSKAILDAVTIKAIFGAELPPAPIPNVPNKENKQPTKTVKLLKTLPSIAKKEFSVISQDSPLPSSISLSSTPTDFLYNDDYDSELRDERSESTLRELNLLQDKKSGRKLRRKFRSGFDYIRKKKTTKTKAEEETIQSAKKKIPIRKRILWPEHSRDIANEVRGWVINKGLGETVLHKAARLQYHDVVIYCLEGGDYDVNAKDNAGYTPLHEACNRGHLDVAQTLCAHNAHVNATGYGGMRPLHEAIENSHIELARLLLAYGADPSLTTYGGQSCLALASDRLTQKFLKDYLADLKAKKTEPWHISGPSFVFDREEDGANIFFNIPLDIKINEIKTKIPNDTTVLDTKTRNDTIDSDAKTQNNTTISTSPSIDDSLNEIKKEKEEKSSGDCVMSEIIFECSTKLLPNIYSINGKSGSYILLKELLDALSVTRTELIKMAGSIETLTMSCDEFGRRAKCQDFGYVSYFNRKWNGHVIMVKFTNQVKDLFHIEYAYVN